MPDIVNYVRKSVVPSPIGLLTLIAYFTNLEYVKVLSKKNLKETRISKCSTITMNYLITIVYVSMCYVIYNLYLFWKRKSKLKEYNIPCEGAWPFLGHFGR